MGGGGYGNGIVVSWRVVIYDNGSLEIIVVGIASFPHS